MIVRGARWGKRPVPDPAALVSDAERLAAVASAARSGLSAAQAWDSWAGSPVTVVEGVPQLGRSDPLARDAMAAARLAHTAGVPLGDLVGALARLEAVRESARLSRGVALAGPLASAKLLTWLPAVGLALGVVVEPAAARVLAATPFGWGLLAVAAFLVTAGRRWMRTLVRAAQRAGEVP